MHDKIAVLINSKLHNELVLRTRKSDDVTHFIEHAIESFLDNNVDNASLWSEEYLNELDERKADGFSQKYGNPNAGYIWNWVVLPNGSRLKMTYKDKDHFAEVRFGKIMFENKEFSPSEWASKVANNTSRNAWRDIYVQTPEKNDWKLAEVMRQEMKAKSNE